MYSHGNEGNVKRNDLKRKRKKAYGKEKLCVFFLICICKYIYLIYIMIIKEKYVSLNMKGTQTEYTLKEVIKNRFLFVTTPTNNTEVLFFFITERKN